MASPFLPYFFTDYSASSLTGFGITATSDGTNPTALEDILDTTLADNGGSTQTHALADNSPAIDAGSNPQSLTTDQRGYIRTSGNGTDIGAYESIDTLFGGSMILEMLEDPSTQSTITGSLDDDVLTGSDSNDFIDGLEGNDTLTGGGGDDQFVLAAGYGSDLITDFEDGQDFLVLDSLTFDQLTIEAADNGTVISLGDEVLVTLDGVESSLITSDDFTSLV